jgi:UDP-glucose 4-epimerase
MVKSVIISGGNGFIGSHLVKQLIKENYDPVVLLRPGSNLKRLESIKNLKKLITDNYEDKKIIRELISYSPIYFFHCAWGGVLGSKRNDKRQSENVNLVIKSIKLTKEIGCSKWTGLGSHAEYGNLNEILTEESKCNPTTLYGKNKLKSCMKSMQLCKSYGIIGNWIRVFNTYGPYDNQSWLIPYIIKSLKQNKSPNLTECNQIWDYLHVTDAVKAIIKVSEVSKGGVFNLGSENPRKLKEFISIITNEVKSKKVNFGKIPYRKDQVMYLHPDVTKIKKITSWAPKVSFESGVKQLINLVR